MKKINIEIWSDVICPFCYIGKRKLEKALENYEHKDSIEIIWKSYQLNPNFINNDNKSTYQLVANKYGVSIEQSKEMHKNVTQTAKNIGLEFNFDNSKTVDTLKAHLLIHLAKLNGRQNDAEELLFKAYFTDGKDISDINTLIEIGESIGLESIDIKNTINNNIFIEDVQKDIYEASLVGVRGVPFFVINQKYAISGAQEPDVFFNTITKAYSEL